MERQPLQSEMLSLLTLFFIIFGISVGLVYPSYGRILKWLSIYAMFLFISDLGEVKLDLTKILVTLILGISLILSVSFISSAIANSAIWGGLGANLDDLVDAIIRLLEWCKANGVFDQAVDGGIVI